MWLCIVYHLMILGQGVPWSSCFWGPQTWGHTSTLGTWESWGIGPWRPPLRYYSSQLWPGSDLWLSIRQRGSSSCSRTPHCSRWSSSCPGCWCWRGPFSLLSGSTTSWHGCQRGTDCSWSSCPWCSTRWCSGFGSITCDPSWVVTGLIITKVCAGLIILQVFVPPSSV